MVQLVIHILAPSKNVYNNSISLTSCVSLLQLVRAQENQVTTEETYMLIGKKKFCRFFFIIVYHHYQIIIIYCHCI